MWSRQNRYGSKRDRFTVFGKARHLPFWRSIFSVIQGRYYIGKPDTIAIHETRTPKEEAYAAAAQIRRLVREEGMRYREIGVVATDLNGYGDYLEEAFAKYRIPVFMDYKRSILLNSFVEYVRSILNMAEQSFTYESVFRFLRAGYGPFTDDEVDELENYCLALGIRGYKKLAAAMGAQRCRCDRGRTGASESPSGETGGAVDRVCFLYCGSGRKRCVILPRHFTVFWRSRDCSRN